MGHAGSARRGLLLTLGLLPALVVGAYLFLRDARATPPSPTAAPTRVAASLATAIPTPAPTTTLAIGPTPSPEPTATTAPAPTGTPVPPPPPPTAAPAPAWVEVGRWRDSQVFYTDTFTVGGRGASAGDSPRRPKRSN